jgi:hypothetical protein
MIAEGLAKNELVISIATIDISLTTTATLFKI